MKKFLLWVLGLFLFAVIGVLIAFWTPDTDRAAMEAKYTNAASKFLVTELGDRIHYRDEGNKDGPAFLLFHGANSSIQAWEPLIARLGQDYRFISLDFPGHGLTGPNASRDYSANVMHKAALDILNEVGVERAVWVGNSMGGWLTWRGGVEHPERVSGLVLISPSGAPLDAPRELYLGAKLMQTGVGRLLVPKITPRSLIESSIQSNIIDHSKINDAMIDRYWELLRLPGNRVAAGDRALVDREDHMWDRVSEIAVPVLILWGEGDTVSPYTLSVKYADVIADTEIHIYPNVGHLAMEEVPDRVARDIQDWTIRHFQTPPN